MKVYKNKNNDADWPNDRYWILEEFDGPHSVPMVKLLLVSIDGEEEAERRPVSWGLYIKEHQLPKEMFETEYVEDTAWPNM